MGKFSSSDNMDQTEGQVLRLTWDRGGTMRSEGVGKSLTGESSKRSIGSLALPMRGTANYGESAKDRAWKEKHRNSTLPNPSDLPALPPPSRDEFKSFNSDVVEDSLSR